MQGSSNYLNQAMDSAFSFSGALASPAGRESNVFSYNSPTFGGFNFTLSYGPGASEGNAYSGGGTQGKEQVYVATARYTGGPIRAQFDYGTRKDVGNVDSQDRNAWKVGVGWAYAPNSQISAIFGNVEEYEAAKRGDPVPRFRARLVTDGVLSAEDADAIAEAAQKEMQEAVEFGLASPHPAPEKAVEYVYA